ncbi:unnamed protein product [Cochlearia groenlandica]
MYQQMAAKNKNMPTWYKVGCDENEAVYVVSLDPNGLLFTYGFDFVILGTYNVSLCTSCFNFGRLNLFRLEMDLEPKKFSLLLNKIEAEADQFLLARNQILENDKERNGNREALTALRKIARTTKSSVSSSSSLQELSIVGGVKGRTFSLVLLIHSANEFTSLPRNLYTSFDYRTYEWNPGLVLLIVSFVKDRDFHSFFAVGSVILYVVMALRRVMFEWKIEDLAFEFPKQALGDIALAVS